MEETTIHERAFHTAADVATIRRSLTLRRALDA
jgi:hypothetical protein